MTEVWQRCADPDRAEPGEWTTRDTTPLPDGGEIEIRRRFVEADPLGQAFARPALRPRARRVGESEAEDHRLRGARWYGVHEMIGMLEGAGFDDVRVEGDYTPVEVTADHRMHVFIARRP